MRSIIKTIAAVAPLAVLGLADAGSSGGDSHGHNYPNPYEQEQNRELQQQHRGDSPLHINVPGLLH